MRSVSWDGVALRGSDYALEQALQGRVEPDLETTIEQIKAVSG